MEDLIKITVDENGQQLVSARELHEFLEVTERFQQWFDKKVKKYDFIEDVDFTGCKIFHTLAKQEIQDYALTIEMAKELSMVQNNEKGDKARKYFLACERKANDPHSKEHIKILSEIYDKIYPLSEGVRILNNMDATKNKLDEEIVYELLRQQNWLTKNNKITSIGFKKRYLIEINDEMYISQKAMNKINNIYNKLNQIKCYESENPTTIEKVSQLKLK